MSLVTNLLDSERYRAEQIEELYRHTTCVSGLA